MNASCLTYECVMSNRDAGVVGVISCRHGQRGVLQCVAVCVAVCVAMCVVMCVAMCVVVCVEVDCIGLYLVDTGNEVCCSVLRCVLQCALQCVL